MTSEHPDLDFQIYADLQNLDQPVVIYDALHLVYERLQNLTLNTENLQSVQELLQDLQDDYVELTLSEHGKLETTMLMLDFGEAIVTLTSYINKAAQGDFDDAEAHVIDEFHKLYEKTKLTLNIAVDTTYEFEEEVLQLFKDLNVFYIGETTTFETYDSMLRLASSAVFVFRHEDPYLKTNIDQLVMLAKAINAKRNVIVIELGNLYLEDRQLSRLYDRGYENQQLTVFSGPDAWQDFFKWVTHVDEPETDDPGLDTEAPTETA